MESLQKAADKKPQANGAAGDAIQGLQAQVDLLRREVAKVIVGKQDVVDKLIVASLTEGAHILFEDMPGLAKSVLAATFSKAAGCQFNRIQFTPDLLPTDITGGHIFNRKTNDFDFRPGPIFTNFLLADEINRASPKTQSALLEAMAEKQVSVEGITHRLEPPFLVLATQNPVEQEGTYPLPEAPMDRFAMKLSMGYPSKDEEAEIMSRRLLRKHDSFDTKPVMDRAQFLKMQKVVEEVFVDATLVDYIARIIDATRHHPDLVAGASPRGSLALMKLARAHAAIQGRRVVVPDDVRAYAVCCLAHRTILTTEARVRGTKREKVIQDILAKVPVPRPRSA
jgi:MoxR-like ATPase